MKVIGLRVASMLLVAMVGFAVVSIGKRRIVKSYGLRGELYGHAFEASSLTPIAIDVGRRHGLRKNMLLRFAGDQFNLPGQYIRVTSVGSQTATAVLIRPVDERNNESYAVNHLYPISK